MNSTILHLIKNLDLRFGGYIFARQLAEQVENILGVKISKATIQHYRLKVLKLYYRRSRLQPKIFSQFEKNERFNFASNLKSFLMKDQNLHRIWSADESSLQTMRRNFYHHRVKGTYPKCGAHQPRAYKAIHVWTAISTRGFIPPAIFTQNLCSQGYEIIINNHIARNVNQGDIFIQDNSSVHTAEICMQAMNNNNISVLALPAYSPDLSIIELMWHDLKFYVRMKECRNIQSLNHRIQKFFHFKLKVSKCERYINRLLKVLDIVIERNGDWSDC